MFTNRTLMGERGWGGRDLLLFLTLKREKARCTVHIAGMEHGKALGLHLKNSREHSEISHL